MGYSYKKSTQFPYRGVGAGREVLHCGGGALHFNEGEYIGSMRDQEKLRILLVYWMEHNLEHAQDFRQWARRAEAFGSNEAASKLEAAAQEMTVLNNSLHTALDLLGGPPEQG